MPIYEYSCRSCGKVVDVLQKVSDPAPAFCTECGAEGTLSKVVSRTSFVLKGGGWYADLYSSPKKEGAKSEPAGDKKESSGTSSSSTSTSAPASTPVAAASGDKK